LEVPLASIKGHGGGKWVNNEQIFIDPDYTQPLSPKVLINPFTISKVSINLPSAYPDQLLTDSSGTELANAELDPSMNYAVYPAIQGDTFGLELFSRKLNRQIAFFPSLLPPVSVAVPQWNSDGTKFVFNSTPLEDKDESRQYNDELHLGGVDGKVHQLTLLSEQISGNDLGRLAWSPNDRYVAFVVFDSSTNRLMFLDMLKEEVIDVCIDSGEGYFQGLIWSPDGNQLAINVDDDPFQIMLIDIPTMRGVTFLPKVGYAQGWVVLQP